MAAHALNVMEQTLSVFNASCRSRNAEGIQLAAALMDDAMLASSAIAIADLPRDSWARLPI